MLVNDAEDLNGYEDLYIYLEAKSEFLRSLPLFPLRNPTGHKGTYGLSLLVGGSRGMSGSISLAGKAALTAGSGLVRLLVPASILEVVAGYMPEYMTVPLANDFQGRLASESLDSILEQSKRSTVMALGPGLGQSTCLNEMVLRLFEQVNCPLVLDADALNALAEADLLRKPSWDQSTSSVASAALFSMTISEKIRIFTPHPGEFARLIGTKPSDEDSNRLELALNFVKKYRERFSNSLILVLKGHRTLITDGDSFYFNETGNPGMGTGGSGDVLTGLITGLLAQKMEPMTAVRLAVALHGLAGDLAALKMPMECLLASHLIQYFPDALSCLRQIQKNKEAIPEKKVVELKTKEHDLNGKNEESHVFS